MSAWVVFEFYGDDDALPSGIAGIYDNEAAALACVAGVSEYRPGFITREAQRWAVQSFYGGESRMC